MKPFFLRFAYCTLFLFLLVGRALGQVVPPEQVAPTPKMVTGRPLRVLIISGDWKGQAWFQDVWMQGKGEKLLRGRFIAHEVEKAAPGQFEFTDINSYLALQYGDFAYFSQFDVVVMAEIFGWSMPPRFHEGLKKFVENGGGFLYAGSYKWQFALMKDTPFEEVLPARFPVSGLTEDWKNGTIAASILPFQPQLVAPNHPVTHGLNWAKAPNLIIAANVLPKAGAQTLLKTPDGAPILDVWSFGKGRSAISAAIFSNDDSSAAWGEWPDFGRYYAQFFSWLGENSTRQTVKPKAVQPEVTVSIDATREGKGSQLTAKEFSIHSAPNNPGLQPLSGLALENYQKLNLAGGWARLDVREEVEPQNDDADSNHFNWEKFNFRVLDGQVAECQRLELEPVLLFPFNYNRPDWMWKDKGCTWSNATPEAAAELAELVAATVEHFNGRGANYQPRIRYIEVLNEPNVDDRNMDAFVRLFRTVAQRIHRDYPGIRIGAFGNHEIPYLKTFLEKVEPDLDWISTHPYGWTGEMLFNFQDEILAFQREKKLRELPFFITEWDFWIRGRSKFDYMMRRQFELVKRERVLGALQYRLGQYEERGFLFGVLWTGSATKRGGEEKGAPMDDAYDAFWLWRDFRGARVPVEVSSPSPFSFRLHADATRSGEKVAAVLYGDWGGDGDNFHDFARQETAATLRVRLQMQLAPSARPRRVVIGRADGEAFQLLPDGPTIAAGATRFETMLDIPPLTGWSVSVE